MGLRKNTPQLSVLPLEAGKLPVGFDPERLPGTARRLQVSMRKAWDKARNSRTGKPEERGRLQKSNPYQPTEAKSLSKSTRHGWALPAKDHPLLPLMPRGGGGETEGIEGAEE